MTHAIERIAVRDGNVGSPKDLAERVRQIGIALYRRAAAHCEGVGLILADTKFELGLVGGDLILVDEALTPDSPLGTPAPTNPAGPGELRQAVRPGLAGAPAMGQDGPGPGAAAHVVEGTRARYVEAFERITGASFERYLREDVIGP